MIKYIQDVVDDLGALQTGIKSNSDKWQSLPITDGQLQAGIDELTAKSKEITTAETTLAMRRTEGRNLAEKNKKLVLQTENLAVGLHADNPEGLLGYGILPRKTPSSIPVPGKATIASIADDVDGEGFIISIQSLANAETFDVERGLGEQTDVLVLAPPYLHYSTLRKLSFVDSDVKRGVRYFYRVRGANRNGYGEWSEPVSQVH